MNEQSHTSQRIVIVGGGFSGLATAARLAQTGLPITLLETSKLGYSASTRNQGWLHSGAWYAPQQPDLARMCHDSLKQTVSFCPDCLEPQHQGMAFLISKTETLVSQWSEAWTQVGIPFEEYPLPDLFDEIPGLKESEIQHAYLLPDRAFRPDVLLTHLAATAEHYGAEIRTETPVVELVYDGNRVTGVLTGTGETIATRFVILATGALGTQFLSDLATEESGRQSEYTRVALKSHLVAIEPHIGMLPFCVVDAGGFNHIPHAPKSVFGSNRWSVVADAVDQSVVPEEIDLMWEQIHRFLPKLNRDSSKITEWAGTTIQAMHYDQVEPGVAPLPTIIDHNHEPKCLCNVLSVFPGRATLWSQLAEDTRRIVLDKLNIEPKETARPPWETDRARHGA